MATFLPANESGLNGFGKIALPWPNILEASYIFVGLTFMYAIRGLGNPVTANFGNFSGIIGIMVALFFVTKEPEFYLEDLPRAGAVMAVSLIIGLFIANKAEMIIMPQMVAGFHCMVGLAAVLVAFARYFDEDVKMNSIHIAETAVGIFFGGLTFTGSVIAAGKLQGTIGSNPRSLPLKHFMNMLFIIGSIAASVPMCMAEQERDPIPISILTALSFILGIHLVMSIGGADMPVVVSMLNSYSGWTTVAAGFMLNNDLLIIAGSIIGSSGGILSYIMCKAMNRSFISVIAGGFGVEEGTTVEVSGTHTITNVDEVADDLVKAKSVIIVPGYGMAVARCQGDVGAMVDVLRKSGVRVRFGIHEVAGRLPGHMNVLLAEANVPYDIVAERATLVPDMPNTDVTLVIGANDIVNPLAEEDTPSAVKGMPVLQVWKAKKCIVMKRSLATGYAGVDNPLFYKENTSMLLGNASKTIADLLGKIRAKAQVSDDATTISNEKTGLLSDQQQVLPVEKTYPTPLKTLGVLWERIEGETRVAINPDMVTRFRELAFQVVVQRNAGASASYPDRHYENKGALLVDTARDVFAKSDVVVKITDWTIPDLINTRPGQILVGYFWPSQAAKKELLDACVQKNVTAVSMDCVPRITVAQKCDTLSSMANMAGYKAVVDAFYRLPRFSKPLITAAGKLPPAKVFVIGVGVAGLSAIGTARSLGALVQAHDTRAAVKEQVESMGAEFIVVKYKEAGEGAGGYAKEMSEGYQRAQLELYKKIISESDVVVTTANIPGVKAPLLVTKEMVMGMRPGSVCVDLAATNGGNIALTRPGEVYTDPDSGVVFVGLSNMAATMPSQASDLYAANLGHYFDHIGGASKLDDLMAKPELDTLEVIKPTIVVRGGKFLWTKPAPPPSAPPAKPKAVVEEKPEKKEEEEEGLSLGSFLMTVIFTFGLFLLFGIESTPETLQHIIAFVMAVIIGYFLVWGVDPALHTPLMAVTNAISGIIVTGGLLQIHGPITDFSVICALLAVLFSSINVFGGFLLTKKMLDFFHK